MWNPPRPTLNHQAHRLQNSQPHLCLVSLTTYTTTPNPSVSPGKLTSFDMVSDDPAGPSSATATATGSGSTRPPRHTDLIFPSAEQHASMSSLLGSLKRSTLSVHNRLASIHADARFVSRAAAALSTTTTTTTAATTSTSSNTTKGGGKTSRRNRKRQRQQKRQRRPLVANERCGSWYVPPGDKAASAYFKSTDGHERAWKFSTRRLNLHLVEMIEKNDGYDTSHAHTHTPPF